MSAVLQAPVLTAPATPTPRRRLPLPGPLDPAGIADLVVDALVAEATLTPKPGLVDLRGGGAHHDMDVGTMVRSAEALRGTFAAMAIAGRNGSADQALRERLAQLGRDGEQRMLDATNGVNTHRGAIWALGLVSAAAAHGPAAVSTGILERAATIARFEDRFAPHPTTPGSRVRSQYRVPGAVGEARAAFPHAVLALSLLRSRRATGASETTARLDALAGVIASLDDTCLLHRGGLAGLRNAQRGAAEVLRAGGVATLAGSNALRRLDDRLTADRLSPGGSADLLALAIFLEAVEVASLATVPTFTYPTPSRKEF